MTKEVYTILKSKSQLEKAGMLYANVQTIHGGVFGFGSTDHWWKFVWLL